MLVLVFSNVHTFFYNFELIELRNWENVPESNLTATLRLQYRRDQSECGVRCAPNLENTLIGSPRYRVIPCGYRDVVSEYFMTL